MKKIITLLLTLIMAVSLGSCKNSKKNKKVIQRRAPFKQMLLKY